jgi:BirA family biotin operon repressor/biotin-[acetyl-CoA-carboxylase] ligase
MTAPGDGRTIVRLDAVDSTQPIGFDLADLGAADGTAVVADAQTLGRGRRGRVWHAEAGTSLLLSVLLRPALEPSRLPLLSFAAALAVAGALEQVADVPARLKWPNDVLVGGRKIAGVLLESRVSGTGAVVVVGIGVNLRQTSFPAAMAQTATSVWLATGRDVDREAVLIALLAELDRWRFRLDAEGFEPVRARWLALTDTIGKRVTVDALTGIAVDLAMDGALIVDDGTTLHRIVAGDVVLGAGSAGADAAVDAAGQWNRDAARR